MPVCSVGHSTLEASGFAALRKRHGVSRLVDVRTLPRSRRVPWTNVETLPGLLAAAGIAHLHSPGLGGLRTPRVDSPNGALRDEGFRGYADPMETPDFQRALSDLVRLSERETVAVMCAEASPWKCHRSRLSDALVARGVEGAISWTARRRPTG